MKLETVGVVACMMFVVVAGLSAVFGDYAEKHGDPLLDWAAGRNGGWCCVRPGRSCVPSQLCIRESSYQGGPCMETVASEHCVDLCDEWKRQPGGRGKACGGAP